MADNNSIVPPQGCYLAKPTQSQSGDLVNLSKCIVCQKQSAVKVTSTDIGRKRLQDASVVRDDEVTKRIRSLPPDAAFVYHSDNKCYKTYTMEKTLASLRARHPPEIDSVSSVESNETSNTMHIANLRSSKSQRPEPSCCIPPSKLKCIVCGKQKYGEESTKYRLSEEKAANKFLAAVFHFQDDVFHRVSDLDSKEKVFAADLFYHHICLARYIGKYDSALKECVHTERKPSRKFDVFLQANITLQPLLEAGYGFSLSDVRDYMNIIDGTLTIHNSEIKSFLVKKYGESIIFCPSKRRNESLMFFSSTLTAETLASKIRSQDAVKDAADILRKDLVDVDFGLTDKFCDAQELNQSWTTTKIPDTVLTFLSTLCNVNKSHILNASQNDANCSADGSDSCDNEDADNLDNNDLLLTRLSSQIHCLFQVLFYIVHRGRKTSPLQVLVGHSVYDKCKSRELITSLNRGAFSVSYNDVLRNRQLLSSYAVHVSGFNTTPLPSHFTSSCFTIGALDNFDFEDKSSVSGSESTHHTAMVLFQECAKESHGKASVSQTGLSKRRCKLTDALPCQIVCNSHRPVLRPGLSEDFKTVEYYDTQPLHNNIKITAAIAEEFLINLTRCGLPNEQDLITPTWSGIHALISSSSVPLKRVGFLPVIPSPVTDYSTVFTALKNFVNIREQLQQPILPVFSDEGVFHTVVDICMTNPNEFKELYPMLGMFHFAKVVLRCAGRYLTGCGIDDAFLETGVFGSNTLHTVLNATHYARSLHGMLIVEETIRCLQWQAFWEKRSRDEYSDILPGLATFKQTLSGKQNEECQAQFIHMNMKIAQLHTDFNNFIDECVSRSEMCQYWSIFLEMIDMLKQLIIADREGNWQLHVNTVESLMRVCREWDCVNYLRYGSWYLEKVKVLEWEHPELYSKFMGKHFVVKDKPGSFNAVSADMKLEQTIQRSQKSSKGIIGQTRKCHYVAQWQLVYHEVLAICNVFRQLTNCKLMDHHETVVHHELGGRKADIFNDNVTRLLAFVQQRSNPYTLTPLLKLHNIVTQQYVDEARSVRILSALRHGQEKYDEFRMERFIKREKKLSDTISRVNLPQFLTKSNTKCDKDPPKVILKQVTQCQKNVSIARERGEAMKSILSHDILLNNPLFEDDCTAKPVKHSLLTVLESKLNSDDYIFDGRDGPKATIVVDFMSQVRKLNMSKIKTFGDIASTIIAMVRSQCNVDNIHVVFDSYIECSVKECERMRRSQFTQILELATINELTPIPVQMNKFWTSGTNKRNLELLVREQLKVEADRSIFSVVVSGMVMDNYILDAILVTDGKETVLPDLALSCEEADTRIVPHVNWAIRNGAKRVVVLSNDTDVVVLLLRFMANFMSHGLRELWVRFGVGDKTRFLPLHVLLLKLGEDVCKVLIKVHILTGCDSTSKIGTKQAAMKQNVAQILKDFGEVSGEGSDIFAEIEAFLVRVWKHTAKESTFDELRYSEFKRTGQMDHLPPTSSSIHGHIRRSLFLIRENINLLNTSWISDDPRANGWIEDDGMLLPDKCLHKLSDELLVTCGCSRCGDERCKCKKAKLLCTEFCRCGRDQCKNN